MQCSTILLARSFLPSINRPRAIKYCYQLCPDQSRLTLSHPYFSLNRAPGTMNGSASSFPSFFSMAKARIPGLSLRLMTKAGSSHRGGRTWTSSLIAGFSRALGLSAGTIQCDLHVAVVFSHLVFSMGNVNDSTPAPAPILWVCANDFEALGVNSSCQGVPERILDHAR